MGRITTPVRIQNDYDVERAALGEIPREAIREIDVPDALIETGASSFCLPPSLIQALGLRARRQARSKTAGGLRMMTIYSPVFITIQDRHCSVEVTEIPEEAPVLVGQVPLEVMDLVAFPKEQRLGPNPAHDNQWVIEIY